MSVSARHWASWCFLVLARYLVGVPHSANIQLVWFKRDLRTIDHAALSQAAQCGPVLPLFIVEPDYWQASDVSGRQWDFVTECIEELQSKLAALGQPLIIRNGEAVDVLERLCRAYGVSTVWSHEETGNQWTYARDIRVAEWAKSRAIEWRELRQSGVVRRLRTRNGWARQWDATMGLPAAPTLNGLVPLNGIDPGGLPSAHDLGMKTDHCPQRQRGGRVAALKCFQSFLSVRGAPYRKAMSSPIAGAKHCSRISPHLAWGTLSMKEVAQATWTKQKELKLRGVQDSWNGAMSSFEGRLHWRDHFIQKLEDQPNIEFRNLHRAYDGLRPNVPDQTGLQAWMKGETGLPFVDACMRSLHATGWLNFRMRAMLMAFASYHLWLDWRRPGEHLARMFTDYEPGIHWSQVQMQSGTTGINTVRIYNPIKQGYDQDPEGHFIRQWIPELTTVPDQFLHEPWTWEGAGAVLGRAYPVAVVNHLQAAKEAREKVWSVRRGSGFRGRADAIQNKHGSRKAGIKNRGQRPSRKSETNQLSLPLSTVDNH